MILFEMWSERARKANACVTFNCLTFFPSDNVQQSSIVLKYLTFTYQYQGGNFWRILQTLNMLQLSKVRNTGSGKRLQ